jgi:hypothetical protein
MIWKTENAQFSLPLLISGGNACMVRAVTSVADSNFDSCSHETLQLIEVELHIIDHVSQIMKLPEMVTTDTTVVP